MATQVLMPQLGESVVEGTITRWLKGKGEAIQEFEPMLEVNTDKVDTEVPSPASGVILDILVEAGTTVKAGALLALIGTAGESAINTGTASSTGTLQTDKVVVANTAPYDTPPASQPATPVSGRNRDLGFISPVVARLASEHNVDLFQVPGSGLSGRITKKDVLAYLENRPIVPTVAPAVIPATEPVSLAPVPATAPQVSSAIPAELPAGIEYRPHTTLRRQIAEHMVQSKHTSPHVTTIMEVDLSRVIAHRSANKAIFERDGVNLTFTPYFVAATASALKAYPVVNSSWSEEGLLLHRQINIGMATSLGEAGLIVPVIKHADGFSLLGLARVVNDLATRARARQLKPDEVKGGTFTITNHGISGSLFATPIINQPQCGILGVGMVHKRVVVISDKTQGDTIAIRPMVYLGLTFDHRILDGATADYFLGKIVETLQNWS